MKRGEIYLVDLEPPRGHEQRGHRPVLIVSSTEFNSIMRLPIVAPISNGAQFARKHGLVVPLIGTKTTGVVRCDQPRALDIAERGGRFVEVLPVELIEDVLARISALFVA